MAEHKPDESEFATVETISDLSDGDYARIVDEWGLTKVEGRVKNVMGDYAEFDIETEDGETVGATFTARATVMMEGDGRSWGIESDGINA